MGKVNSTPLPRTILATLAGGDSEAVYTAANDLLDQVTEDGFQVLHLELPATGGTVPPVYGFMESVRTYGVWKDKNPHKLLRVILYVQSDVMLNVTSNRIDINELLSSDLTRFWVVVSSDAYVEPVRRVLYYRPDTYLRVVLDDLGVPCSTDWLLSVSPSPYRDGVVPPTTLTAHDLCNRRLVEVGIVFGSILTVERVAGVACPPAVVTAAR